MHLQGEENRMLLTSNSFSLKEEEALGGCILSGKGWRSREKGIFKQNGMEELYTKVKMNERLRS